MTGFVIVFVFWACMSSLGAFLNASGTETEKEEKSKWEEEAEKAANYSKQVTYEIINSSPQSYKVVAVSPASATQKSLYASSHLADFKQYLRAVCYGEKGFFEDEHAHIAIKTTDDNTTLTLRYGQNEPLSAMINGDKISHIHYARYGVEDRHLVRAYFEKVLESFELETESKGKEQSLSFVPVKEVIRVHQEKVASYDYDVEKFYAKIQVLLDELREKGAALSPEWQHKTTEHFREPIAQMIQQYKGLSSREKARVYEPFCILLSETVQVLEEQAQMQDEKKTELLIREMELLKSRLQTI